MKTERLQAFSDGVIAVIITIMVLELKAPQGADLGALLGVLPAFLSYVLSFIYVGLYWNNHHHFFQLVGRVTGGILWANLHLLFWLSLIPFATAWLNEHPTSAVPTALYGAVLLAAAGAWFTMQTIIVRADGDSRLQTAIGRDLKGKISPVLYLAGILCAFYRTWLADVLFVVPAIMWVIPDRRVERVVDASAEPTNQTMGTDVAHK